MTLPQLDMMRRLTFAKTFFISPPKNPGPSAKSPVQLIPLGAHLRKRKAKPARPEPSASEDEAECSESDFSDSKDEDSDGIDEEEDIGNGKRASATQPTIGECAAAAAKNAAQYSALSDEYNELLDLEKTAHTSTISAPPSSSHSVLPFLYIIRRRA